MYVTKTFWGDLKDIEKDSNDYYKNNGDLRIIDTKYTSLITNLGVIHYLIVTLETPMYSFPNGDKEEK